MDLELRQLRCLVAIVDAGTFSDAAVDLGVSQAAVSRNLQALERPRLRDTRDIDDWLAVIAAGDAVGITPEATTSQYRRVGIVFRELRDAPPIDVRVTWRRHDPHPATHAAVALLTELYRR
jgi:DNA-binding transcriptional LysR family regulator